LVAVCLISFAASLCAQNQQQSAKPEPASANTVPQASDAQENFPRELMQQLETIKTAAMSDDYAYRQLAYLTQNIGPRSSGSGGAKAAVEYVAAQMRDLGLDVHLEEIKVRHWVRGAEKAELVDGPGQPAGTQQKIVLTALGGSTSTGADGITADLVAVDTFDQLKALGRDKLAGKIVLFNQQFDKQKADAGLAVAAYRETVGYRETGPKAAADLGAVAALVRSIGSADYRLPHTGDSDPAGIPAAAVSAEDAALMAHLTAEGPVRIHLTLTPQKLPDETSYNVIGDLKGSEHPEQIVIVSGHLDSWDLGTGALDDGAGVVVTMETAQLLQHLHLHPKRTLRVIAWMDEETDGSGSIQYRKENRNGFPNHIAAIESDVGAAHPLGFLIKMSKAAADALKPVQTVLSSIGATVLQQDSHPPGITDISPMSEEGVPVLGIMQDARSYYNYHHTAADTLDKVLPSELRENAAAMAVMVYALADMKNPLPR
jgi:Zn-dependent M28 family amino/carboxypeptidase